MAEFPTTIKNGVIKPILEHDTKVLKYIASHEFTETQDIDAPVVDKLEQHLAFREDKLFSMIRRGELQYVLPVLPARFFNDDVTSPAGGASETDDPRTIENEKRPRTISMDNRTVENLKRVPTTRAARPKGHPSSKTLTAYDVDSVNIDNVHLAPYFAVLADARHELATRDGAHTSASINGEEALAQFSYMNELFEALTDMRSHKSMPLPELERDA